MGAVSFPDSEASTQWLEPRSHHILEGPIREHFGTGLETLESASRVDQDEFFFPYWGFLMFEVSSTGFAMDRFHRFAPLHLSFSLVMEVLCRFHSVSLSGRLLLHLPVSLSRVRFLFGLRRGVSVQVRKVRQVGHRSFLPIL